MHFGSIICSLGTRYRSYCSNVVRTLIVNPTSKQSQYYEYLNNLMDWAISQMKPGVIFSDFYNLVVNKVRAEHPKLVDKLVRNFGCVVLYFILLLTTSLVYFNMVSFVSFVIGIEFRDGNFVIGPKSAAVFREGMSVNLNIGFQVVIFL